MLSFWEKQTFSAYDYAVVGSGIVGLSTAISIKEKQPNASVVVFESGLLPTGASTKNAGFACFGSITELLEDIKVLGKEQALTLVMERYLGLIKLRERLGDANLDYHNHGGYELIREQELYCIDEIETINDLLKDVFDEKPFEEDKSLVKTFGFNDQVVKSLIYSRYEGQIDTGKMMKSLINMAQKLEIRILTGASVSKIEENSKDVDILVADQTYGHVKFKAGSVAICTNAFTKKLITDIDLNPGRGIVLVTKPIENLKFKGVFHCEKGYYYFRNYGDRVIFGGGRNLDYEAETTTSFDINTDIKKELLRRLDEIILPKTPYEVDYLWAGIMAFGQNKQPVLKQHSDRIYLGVRLGGMGVAIGSRMGEKLAEMMI
ncbi:FAD-binding oxidoreductase [Fulvivirga sp. 29W222]|uniref:FAD-binding oxidoreductase n=1 Tax=Fulvivirga marina TaxID=2494733 RepID=A0A937FWC6_9BACT|nr:FAD-dependent oxidoreductase [Fulvivirga marina]MBL6447219.1 FAD-binding oxidoreductase [Fulvivirga marina]